MKLTHFSRTNHDLSLRGLQDVDKQPVKDVIKPKGLWLSWDWCRGEEFGDYHQRQEVTLKSNALVSVGPRQGIVYLENLYDIDMFTRSYGNRVAGRFMQWIDWRKVASDYDGLIIAPYQWKARMEYSWYYPWDCASGCIWRPTKWIESISEPEAIEFHPAKEDNYSDE